MTVPAAEQRTKRLRRSPSDLRAAALSAARRLIVEGDDQAMTLRAVADAAGVTHPNLIHHFGSGAGLHAAVAEELVGELLAAIDAIGRQAENVGKDRALLVDRVFDLFDRDGLGRILAWLVRSGEMERTQTLGDMLQGFIRDRSLRAGDADDSRYAEIVMMISFAAYADSAIGPLFGQMLHLPDSKRRATMTRVLNHLLSEQAVVGDGAGPGSDGP